MNKTNKARRRQRQQLAPIHPDAKSAKITVTQTLHIPAHLIEYSKGKPYYVHSHKCTNVCHHTCNTAGFQYAMQLRNKPSPLLPDTVIRTGDITQLPGFASVLNLFVKGFSWLANRYAK